MEMYGSYWEALQLHAIYKKALIFYYSISSKNSASLIFTHPCAKIE